jgi:hypothetical protein
MMQVFFNLTCGEQGPTHSFLQLIDGAVQNFAQICADEESNLRIAI